MNNPASLAPILEDQLLCLDRDEIGAARIEDQSGARLEYEFIRHDHTRAGLRGRGSHRIRLERLRLLDRSIDLRGQRHASCAGRSGQPGED